jgi:hypothetical protein
MCHSVLIIGIVVFLWGLASAQTPPCASIFNNDTTTTLIDGATNAIFWVGNDLQVLFMVTNNANHSLWRSADGGRTWINQMPFLPNSTVPRNGSGTPMAGVSQIIPSVDPNTIYFLGFDGYYWVTRDRGNTYTFYDASLSGMYMLYFVAHPVNPGWLLGFYYNKCCSPTYADNTCNTVLWCHTDLSVSQDYGVTWSFLQSYVSPFYPYSFNWGDPASSTFTNETVYLLHWPAEPYDQRNLYWNNLIFEYTNDLYATPAIATQQSVWALIEVSNANGSVLLLALFDNTNGGTRLAVSRDNGVTLSLISFPDGVPSTSVFEDGYAFLDTTEGAIFVAVLIQTTSNVVYSNVYVSDLYTDEFVLSLQNLVWDVYGSGNVDFTPIEGLEGIYFANYYINGTTNKRSVMSFNKGGTWSWLTPPANSASCPSCSLNLIGPTSSTAPHFETAASALGLILAVGAVGPYVEPLANGDTYFSRDAGSTWVFLRNGSHLFEFGNSGAIIMMIDDDVNTNTVEWTLDQGLNWSQCQFVPLNDTVLYSALDIFTDPNSVGQILLLHTQRFDNSTNTTTYYMQYFNFESLFPRQCVGVNAPNTPNSDFETWNPSDINGECILGMNVTYVRRKQNAVCSMPLNFTTPETVTICSCTRADWMWYVDAEKKRLQHEVRQYAVCVT